MPTSRASEPLNPDQFALPPGDTPSCGNRTDVPKSQRRHHYLDAGNDIRHRPGTGEFKLSHISICVRCGKDKAESV